MTAVNVYSTMVPCLFAELGTPDNAVNTSLLVAFNCGQSVLTARWFDFLLFVFQRSPYTLSLCRCRVPSSGFICYLCKTSLLCFNPRNTRITIGYSKQISTNIIVAKWLLPDPINLLSNSLVLLITYCSVHCTVHVSSCANSRNPRDARSSPARDLDGIM